MTDKDVNDFVERDVNAAKSLSVSKPGPAQAIEGVCWIMAILGVGFLLVTMPFVGENEILTGGQWLGVSLLFILLFGALGLIIRLLRTRMGKEIDRVAERKLGR